MSTEITSSTMEIFYYPDKMQMVIPKTQNHNVDRMRERLKPDTEFKNILGEFVFSFNLQ